MRLTMAERLIRLVLATGLALAVLLPAAMPAAAIIDDNTLRLGTTQAIDATTRTRPRSSRATRRSSSPTTCSSVSARTSSRSRPLPTSWERAADGKSWTFKFRPDMKWSDGQPATSADACFSWQLNLDAIKDGTGVGYDYLTPGIKDAGVTKVECPDATTMVVSTEDNRTGSCRPTSRSCRSTSTAR